jgi:dTDP-4-amino-4,6-dideoxygalactose transaminase
MKFHMNDINAAIGLVNLEHLPSIVQKHKANARRIFEYLRLQIGSDYAGSWISTPDYSDESNYWVYPIRVLRGSRTSLKAHLTKYGIMSSQVHARNDSHTAYQYPCGTLTGLDAFDSQQLNLPCGWWLENEDISKILHALRTFSPCLL